jgi:hypothetical protein
MAFTDATGRLAGKVQLRIQDALAQLNQGKPGIQPKPGIGLEGITVRDVWIDPEDKNLYLFASLSAEALDRIIRDAAQRALKAELKQAQ